MPTFDTFADFHEALQNEEYDKEHVHLTIDNDYVEATYWPHGTHTDDVPDDFEPEILFNRDTLPRYVLEEVLDYLDVPHERP